MNPEKLLASFNLDILFAVESGSRAYGFESPNSDYDIRGVYIQPLSKYLSVDDPQSQVSRTIDEADIVLWDIKKALRLLAASNPSMLDWLSSPIVYAGDPKPFRDLSKIYFSRQKYFMANYGLAKQHWFKYIEDQGVVKLKVYLYTIRAIAACRFVLNNPYAPPVDFRFSLWFNCTDEIDDLVHKKKTGEEAVTIPANETFNQLIQSELGALHHYEDRLAKNGESTDKANEFFYDAVIRSELDEILKDANG